MNQRDIKESVDNWLAERRPQGFEYGERVSVTDIVDRNAAAAAVSWGEFNETGSSKREPGEVFDVTTARLLATGRAFQNLGQAMIDVANARVAAANPTEENSEDQ